MKKAKLIISIFVTLICLTMSSEIYQNYIATFTNQFFYFDLSSDKDREQIYSLLTKTSMKHDMGVFAVDRITENAYQFSVTVYATEGAKTTLEEKYGIIGGRKNSLFSGESKIVFKDFHEIIEDPSIVRYYFTGAKDEVTALRNEVYASFPTSYIHKEGAVGNEWLIWAIWTVSLFFLLLLTWMDIQFQKKENFVLMSLGYSLNKIITKNIVIDTTTFICIFIATYFILENFIYLGYALNFVVTAAVVFCLVNGLLYLTLLQYDYKQILYGANVNERTLSNSYVLKAITMIVTIASLSVNVSLIVENGKYLSYYKDIYKYEDFGLLNIKSALPSTDDMYFDVTEKTKTAIFWNYYKNRLAFSLSVDDEVDGQPIIVLTDTANKLIDNDALLQGIGNYDYHVFIPKSKAESADPEFALLTATTQFGQEPDHASYEVITYEDNVNVLYFDFTVSSKLPFGFSKESNPVFVYCTLSDKVVGELRNSIDKLEHANLFSNFLFKLNETDITAISSMPNVKNATFIPLIEQCEQYRSTLLRVVILNSVISIFLLLLEMTIIVTIINLEYVVNAKILAIKKILGYSIFSKNRSIFQLNLIAAGISIITIVIASLMFGIMSLPIVLIVGLLLTVIEIGLITYNILRLERTSIPKILKGGSL